MIRLIAAIVILAVVGLITRQKVGRRVAAGGGIRVTARTGITRGALAAVIEADERRFLVTITPSSTTVVAELATPAAEPAASRDATAAAIAASAATRSLESLHASLNIGPGANEPKLPSRQPGRSAIAAASTASAAGGASARSMTLLDRARRRTLRSYEIEPAVAEKAAR